MDSSPRTRLPLLALGLALCACSSPAKSKGSDTAAAAGTFRSVEAWSPGMVEIDASVGIILTDLDRSLRAWNKLQLTAVDATDLRTARALFDDITVRATRNQPILIEQLESGAPSNRRVAALALGFTRERMGVVARFKEEGTPEESAAGRARNVKKLLDPVPPLLAALADPVEDVAANAAFALGLIGRRDMPLEGLLEMLERHESPKARTNAAWTLSELMRSEVQNPRVAEAARRGLLDPEPGVRSSCAIICASQEAVDAIDDLALLLHDEVNNPAAAAARALAYIGKNADSKDTPVRGRCARALTGALGKVRPKMRQVILRNLIELADKNLGSDKDEDWIEWAHKLP